MRIADLVTLMETVAPLRFAEEWDKVGLQVGDLSEQLRGPVLLTIDLNEQVLDEALSLHAGAIIAYHPPIFEPLARLTSATPRQRVVLKAARAGIAIYSPHTALDAIPGGITDWLCEGLSGSSTIGKIAGDCRALEPHARVEKSQQMKIVTFVAHADVERVRNALAGAGAGIIGSYQVCSFATEGRGTFLAGPGAKPTVGKVGNLEDVSEVRLEMVCGRDALPLALEMLRRFHPYEEPAIDVYELVGKPQRTTGAGRRLVLDKPITMAELASRLKAWIGRDHVRYAEAHGCEGKLVQRVGVVPGAGSSLSKLARREGCDVFVTGEMKHHDVLGALNAGMAVLLGGHTSTERGYLPRLRDMMMKAQQSLDVRVSSVDRTPFINV
jgi:dinuclear metal center YbgI/SA1388 family protein